MRTRTHVSPVLTILGVCVTACLCQDFSVNLRTGESTVNGSGLVWLDRPSSGCSSECSKQGLLKLTFNKSDRKRAEIKMWLENPTGWSFNIGDSRTNNGWAKECAEDIKTAVLPKAETGEITADGVLSARRTRLSVLVDTRDDNQQAFITETEVEFNNAASFSLETGDGTVLQEDQTLIKPSGSITIRSPTKLRLPFRLVLRRKDDKQPVTAQVKEILGCVEAGDGAEVQGLNSGLSVYRKDVEGVTGVSYGLLHSDDTFIQGLKQITLNIKDMEVRGTNGQRTFYMESCQKLFALNGQPDADGPVNYDVFFAMNRVVAGNYRSGSGLCRAEVTWHSE